MRLHAVKSATEMLRLHLLGTLVVTALDEQVEYGGFTVARENTELLEFLNKRIDYLTDNGNIGYHTMV